MHHVIAATIHVAEDGEIGWLFHHMMGRGISISPRTVGIAPLMYYINRIKVMIPL
jgi:hypothetical protein